MKKANQSEASSLRQRAEEHLRMKLKNPGAKLSSTEVQKLIYELEVHQVELEMQNKELIEAKNQALEVSEKYTNLYDFAPAGYFTLSPKGEILELNIAGAKMFGKDRSQLKNNLFHFFISTDTQKIFGRFIEKVFTGNSKESCEVALSSTTVSLKYVHLEGIVCVNEECCFLTAIDITGRKLMESKLIESKSLLEEVEQTGAIGGWTFDVETLEQKWTQETFKILEIDTAKGEPKVPEGLEFIDEPYRHLAENAIRRATEFGESYAQEWLVTTAKGNKRWVNAVGKAKTDHGRTISLSGSFQDITKRKLAELELQESNKFINILLKTIPFGMDLIDGEGNILYLNEGFKKLFGDETLGKKCWEVFRDDQKQCKECPLHSGIVLGETKLYESHGMLGGKIFEIIHTGMEFKGQKAILEVFIDITGRKLAEQELTIAKERAEESDRLKTAFLCNMSHEIRTPMNGILGFAELLKEPGLNSDQQQEYIRIIEKGGVRMLNIINDIVNISKIESGAMNLSLMEVNVNQQLEYVYKFFQIDAENKELQLYYKTALPANEANLITDKEKLYAILTNLVKNAIKYTDKGFIEFGVSIISTTGAVSEQGKLQFYVKDSGIGIPKNRQEAIFERFIQADIVDKMARQGAGLGLTISKSYVEMLGGKIWVESEEGLGSTFYFTLPYNISPIEKNENKNAVQSDIVDSYAKNLKILIVEDDETSELFLNLIVNIFGKEILTARTGLEAVETCKNNPDIDLIMMDIQLPDLNGYKATAQIRQFNKDVVIIAQTAFGLSGDREKAIAAGCNDYITKPINKAALLTLIQKYYKK